MDPRKRQKLILLGVVGFTLATLSVTAVYLPFYHTVDHRMDLAEFQQKTQGQPNAPKSMWKNIDESAKGQRRF
jgi:hypothetical protein